jgi:hypothetical protein
MYFTVRYVSINDSRLHLPSNSESISRYHSYIAYSTSNAIAVILVTGLTHYLGQDSDAEEMKSESKDFVLVAGTYILLISSDVYCVLCAVCCDQFVRHVFHCLTIRFKYTRYSSLLSLKNFVFSVMMFEGSTSQKHS